MSNDADCLFCKVAAGEVHAEVVLESDTTVAFRDIEPQAPTHVLVIPREHHPNAVALAAAEPGVLVDLFAAAREVAEGEGGAGLVHHVGRDVPGDDLAEQAVVVCGHAATLGRGNQGPGV